MARYATTEPEKQCEFCKRYIPFKDLVEKNAYDSYRYCPNCEFALVRAVEHNGEIHYIHVLSGEAVLEAGLWQR